MFSSPAQLNTPEQVLVYCCEEILLKITWLCGGNGVVVICSKTANNGEIQGTIEGWQNVGFTIGCKDVQEYRPKLTPKLCYPSDVCRVFGLIEKELLTTWKSSVTGFAKSTVSGRLTIRSESTKKKGQIRVLVGETICRRMFVETNFLFS